MQASGNAGTSALLVTGLRQGNILAVGLRAPFLLHFARLLVPCLPLDVWLQYIVVVVLFLSVRPTLVVWKALFSAVRRLCLPLLST
jgi:hypothetical protein